MQAEKRTFTEAEKINARQRVMRNVQRGYITRGACETCGTTENVQGHHEDYAFPNRVTWLCFRHHVELHAERRGGRRKSSKDRGPQCHCGNPAQKGQSYCQTCRAAYMRNWRKASEVISEEQRKRGVARCTVNVYLKRGKISKSPCAVCGASEVKARIYNYSDPLRSIEWLCNEHHAEAVRHAKPSIGSRRAKLLLKRAA